MVIDAPKKITNKNSGRLSLYFKTTRGLSVPHLYQYLQNAVKESVVDTFVLVFHLRDCRGGKGERYLGVLAMQWLFLSYPKRFMQIARHVPNYGRWDDLLYLWPRVLNLKSVIENPSTVQQRQWREHLNRNFYVNIKSEKGLQLRQKYQKELIHITSKQLKEDRNKMANLHKISICAKWAPTEKDSLDREYGTVKELCTAMSTTRANYRKLYTTPLRKYLQVTESLMCKKDWKGINFNNVPCIAMKNLKKAFEKHTPHTLHEWRRNLPTKVNINRRLPHELLCEVVAKGGSNTLCQVKWMSLEDQIKITEVFSHTLTVIDTSVSMKKWKNNQYSFTPMDVAMGLGILISSCIKSSAYQNRVITFSNIPEFVEFKSDDIHTRYLELSNSNWAGRMDFEATFKLILAQAKEKNVEPNDMPRKLLIISDMNFKDAGGALTNFKAIDRQYEAAGYKRPLICFWNICTGNKDFSFSSLPNGVTLISGFYRRIVQEILKGNNLDPWKIARSTLDSDRYSLIRQGVSR